MEYSDQSAEQLFQHAYEHHRRGDLEQAIVLYKQSLEICPTAEAHTFLGWAYSHQGNLDRAIEECRKAIATDPDFGNPYNDIGAYYIEKGLLDEAIPYLEKAMRAKRYECYHYPHLNLGRVYLLKKDYLSALREFEAALQIEPHYALARTQLTRLRAMLN